jgi:hypothetical protein
MVKEWRMSEKAHMGAQKEQLLFFHALGQHVKWQFSV